MFSYIICLCFLSIIFIGYITPFVFQALFGKEGSYMFLVLITMALMSTGSGEVMSVSSILIYDVYKTYVRPFRYHFHFYIFSFFSILSNYN